MSCAPGDTCDYPTGTGIKGSDLTDEQKQLLLKVIANWVDLADGETTQKELDAISATLDETYINWSGATTYDTSQGTGIYLQISGPKAYIELSSQDNSAGAEIDGVSTSGWGHIHTIYRDPTNDYAGSATQQKASAPTMGGGTRWERRYPAQRHSSQWWHPAAAAVTVPGRWACGASLSGESLLSSQYSVELIEYISIA